MRIFEKIRKNIGSALFPAHCFLCKATNTSLCSSCASRLRTTNKNPDSQIYSVLNYQDDSVRGVLHAFKFSNRRDLAAPLAQFLHDRLLNGLEELETMEGFTEPLLVPIPMSKREKHRRGYNQAELLCSELDTMSKESLFAYKPNALLKHKDTQSQSRTKNKKERLANVVGCFTIKDPALVRNQNIILVDDIVTTGATLGEAMKVLKKAGARKVIAITIAH